MLKTINENVFQSQQQMTMTSMEEEEVRMDSKEEEDQITLKAEVTRMRITLKTRNEIFPSPNRKTTKCDI